MCNGDEKSQASIIKEMVMVFGKYKIENLVWMKKNETCMRKTAYNQ